MKPTKQDFEYFKKCCSEYIDKFELNNWVFRFHFGLKHKEYESGENIRNLINCQADIYLDKNYDFENKEEIKRAAKHEVIHSLTGKIYILGRCRFIQEEEFDREEEELVHRLEKLL